MTLHPIPSLKMTKNFPEIVISELLVEFVAHSEFLWWGCTVALGVKVRWLVSLFLYFKGYSRTQQRLYDELAALADSSLHLELHLLLFETSK